MTGNQAVSTMFNFDTCKHMVRIVCWVMRLKTLDLVFISRLQWSMYILRHIDPLCMVRGYVILITHLSHRSTVYSVAMLYYDYMDPQCMIGGHALCF